MPLDIYDIIVIYFTLIYYQYKNTNINHKDSIVILNTYILWYLPIYLHFPLPFISFSSFMHPSGIVNILSFGVKNFY